MGRIATVSRRTSESDITISVDLDGTGRSDIDTGIGFYDHMLTAFAKHSAIDLQISATGDLHVDAHHTVEDTAIVLGRTISEALGDKSGIRRFGHVVVPLDEAVAEAVIDIAGRPYVRCIGEPPGQPYALIGGSGVPFAGSMTQHIFESFALNAGIFLHLTLRSGRDPHHIVEAQFKAVARASRSAVEPDPRQAGVPSTKGTL